MSTHRLIVLISCLLLIIPALTVPWVGAMPATQQDEPIKTPDVGSAQPVFADRVNESLPSTAELRDVQESAPAGMTQDFEGAWPAVGWQLSDESGADGGEFLWGKRDCHPHTGSYAGWSFGGGAQGSLLNCSANYPDSANTWAIYGPFDLRSATSAVLTFHVHGRTAGVEGCPWDYLFVGSSVNGAEFAGGRYCGDWTNGADGAGYHRRTLDLAGRLGQSQVWVGFRFYSNGSVTDLGFTIDDVALDVNGGPMVTPTRTATSTRTATTTVPPNATPTSTPRARVSLPLLRRDNTPTPTPTPLPPVQLYLHSDYTLKPVLQANVSNIPIRPAWPFREWTYTLKGDITSANYHFDLTAYSIVYTASYVVSFILDQSGVTTTLASETILAEGTMRVVRSISGLDPIARAGDRLVLRISSYGGGPYGGVYIGGTTYAHVEISEGR